MIKNFLIKNKRSIILMTIILLLSGGITAYLVIFSAKPETPGEDKNLRLVETIPLSYEPYTMKVTSRGFIVPSRSLSVASNAGGQVLETYKDLKSGLEVEKGTLLIKLDDKLIQNSLALSKVQLIAATAQLSTALKSEGGSMYEKWQNYLRSINTESTQIPPLPPLSGEREKLLTSTYGVLEAYYHVRELEDTISQYSIYAPFSGYISGDGVALYSYISPGQTLLTLTDTTHLEMSIPLTREELVSLGSIQPNAIIRSAGSESGALQGQVERLDAVMDRNSQTVNLHLRFENPELNPLFLPGNYTEVEIYGHTIPKTLILPRSLVNGDETINVYEEGRLKKYPVRVLSVQGEKVILAPSLPDRIQIITTRIQKSFEGMELKTGENEE